MSQKSEWTLNGETASLCLLSCCAWGMAHGLSSVPGPHQCCGGGCGVNSWGTQYLGDDSCCHQTITMVTCRTRSTAEASHTCTVLGDIEVGTPEHPCQREAGRLPRGGNTKSGPCSPSLLPSPSPGLLAISQISHQSQSHHSLSWFLHNLKNSCQPPLGH